MASEPTDALASHHADAWRPLRHVRLATGHALQTWDTGKLSAGRSAIGYELRDSANAPIFHGADFKPSPLRADDSDAALRALLTFLTLRPGDTDPEYFADYTERQQAFCQSDDCELLALLYSEGGDGEFEELDDDPGGA